MTSAARSVYSLLLLHPITHLHSTLHPACLLFPRAHSDLHLLLRGVELYKSVRLAVFRMGAPLVSGRSVRILTGNSMRLVSEREA